MRSCSGRSRCATSIASRSSRTPGRTTSNRREALSPADFLDMKKQSRRVRAARGLRVVDGEPRRPGRARERAGLLRLGGLLSGAGRATGAGPRLPARRGNAGPAPARRPRSRAVAAPVRVRSVDRRPRHRGRRRAVRGRRHRAAGLRLPDGRADLGAARRSMPRTPPTAASLYLTAIGRLAPGRTLEDAKAQMAAIGERLRASIPTPTADARCASTRSATA